MELGSGCERRFLELIASCEERGFLGFVIEDFENLSLMLLRFVIGGL
jgi:hypothetical protein